MRPVIVYTAIPCSYCRAAKALLSARGVSFEEVDLTSRPDARIALMQKTGMRTVPQIFIGDHFVGGYTELAAVDRAGELDTLLGR